jgi:hypothetical protein
MAKKSRQHVRSISVTVDGIKFRSKLEASIYRILKKESVPFEYEKRTYMLTQGFIPTVDCWEHRYGKFRPRNITVAPITYTPDFTCPNGSWVMEVKGRANEIFPMRWKLFRAYVETLQKKPLLLLVSSEKDAIQAVEESRKRLEK